MAKQTINLGTMADNKSGDPLRTAFTKVNENFTELYNVNFTDLGNYKIQGYSLGTQGENGGWGDSPISIDPGGESYSGIWISSVSQQSQGGGLQIYNSHQNGGPIQLTTYGGSWQFNANGSLQLPGIIINSETTKTSVNSGGIATAVIVTNNPNTNWINGTGVFANGINFVVSVTEGVATVSINDGGTGHWPSETFGPVVGSSFGGVDGVDDMYFEVTSIDDSVVQSLDLTKSINKITPLPGDGGGQYTLADGVEGQIMHIVPASASDNEYTTISFDHARWTNGNNTINEGTDVSWWLPFHGSYFGSAIITLIFTDGHWNLPHNYFD